MSNPSNNTLPQLDWLLEINDFSGQGARSNVVALLSNMEPWEETRAFVAELMPSLASTGFSLPEDKAVACAYMQYWQDNGVLMPDPDATRQVDSSNSEQDDDPESDVENAEKRHKRQREESDTRAQLIRDQDEAYKASLEEDIRKEARRSVLEIPDEEDPKGSFLDNYVPVVASPLVVTPSEDSLEVLRAKRARFFGWQ